MQDITMLGEWYVYLESMLFLWMMMMTMVTNDDNDYNDYGGDGGGSSRKMS